MPSWRIAQKGGRLDRARINSSDDVWSQRKRLAWVSRCRYWQGWHLTIGLRGEVLHGGREHLRGWEGRACFALFHWVCKFPWQICLARALACVWLLLAFGWFCSLLVSFFRGNLISILLIGKEHRDLYLLCPGTQGGIFNPAYACNDTFLQCGKWTLACG